MMEKNRECLLELEKEKVYNQRKKNGRDFIVMTVL
jgi:hypothetical protein